MGCGRNFPVHEALRFILGSKIANVLHFVKTVVNVIDMPMLERKGWEIRHLGCFIQRIFLYSMCVCLLYGNKSVAPRSFK